MTRFVCIYLVLALLCLPNKLRAPLSLPFSIAVGRHVGRVLESVPYVVSLAYRFTLTPLLGSEQMSLVQLFVPTEVAHDTVAELGELGNVQFKDVRKSQIC